MNKERRQELSEVIDYLDDAIDRLEEIRDDEEESYDNLPEGLQNAKTGVSMLDAMDALDGFCDEIRVVQNKISDMMYNKRKKSQQ